MPYKGATNPTLLIREIKLEELARIGARELYNIY